MRAIDPAMRQGIVFKVLYYRYYNFDLDQPFQPQYEQNNRHLLELFKMLCIHPGFPRRRFAAARHQ